MNDKFVNVTPNGVNKYENVKITRIDINYHTREGIALAFVHFSGEDMDYFKMFRCDGKDYIIHDGKKYVTEEDLNRLQVILEREKIERMLDEI